MAKKKKSQSKLRRYVIAFFVVVGIFAVLIGYRYYHRVYAPNIEFADEKEFLYIPTGSDYEQLLAILYDKKIVKNIEAFEWVATKMELRGNVHAGKYRLEKNMNNYELVKMIRGGLQEPVKLVIIKFRLKEDVAGFVGRKLEADSVAILNALNDEYELTQFSLTPENSISLIIPNTYEFRWNTNAVQFMKRMKKEYDRFWTADRKSQAALLQLTPAEVITLASIVEEETNYQSEKSTVAGVYLNRIHRGMVLQADPTVKFAIKDFSIKRVLNVHLAFVSPYNTYLNKGLPPGPICTPSIKTVDAVLNAEQHDYLYFCANPDKPGTHSFAKTYQQHLLNARRYQEWLGRQ
ncbi:MAG: endolytic transglycosylase MltG [Chitinophagales bacterium]